MPEPHIAILGAGPAGVGAAYQLRRTGKARVTVLERNATVGGNAGSFEAAGQRLDFGSHRLHPACDPTILQDICELLGSDLLDRPRHGRIRLRGRWIHFPLKPIDLLLRLDPGFGLGVMRDAASNLFRRRREVADVFDAILLANLGKTICENFYFPYARKIWGVEPSALSGIQARRRVSAGSFQQLIKKVLTQVPGLRPAGSGRFFYPRRGYGQITEAYAEAAVRAGVRLELEASVTALVQPAGDSKRWTVRFRQGKESHALEVDQVWSTIPIPLLAKLQDGGVPQEVFTAAENIRYRAMILVYLHLDVDQFTEFDAHYFPDERTTITRLSEPKNYAAESEPRDRTTLCAELPCALNDAHWQMDDEALGQLVVDDLRAVGLPLSRPPVAVSTKRLPQAYPIYLNGYEQHFRVLDEWANSIPGLLTYGRQGLFAHDNTHHALAMAYAAVDCVMEDGFNHDRWAAYRETFTSHVVED
ncbi:MAG: FAD-dependent oxidoreductase [Gemmatimonadetes bacterium]|nr:FAD-dependent oxidoreductase [Gemmatimonadota bacterium]